MTPEIIEREEMIVVGVRSVLAIGENAFEDVWKNEFLPRCGEIAGAEKEYCGVFNPLPDDKDGRYEYVAGVLTDSLEDIPIGMVGWIVPAGTYAIGESRGLRDIYRACRELITVWLPDSGYHRLPSPMFAFTPERHPERDDAPWRVGVPVEKIELLPQLESWLV